MRMKTFFPILQSLSFLIVRFAIYTHARKKKKRVIGRQLLFYDSYKMILYKSPRATNELLDLDESRNRRTALSSPFRKSIRGNRG